MSHYQMPSRQLPLEDGWDVIVVGGGPSGCTAAAAAAREGARTLLIEATGMLGGMGTAGLVPAWCPFSDQEKIIYRGLAQKVFEATKARMPHVAPESMNWVPIDPEALKIVYDELVTAAGVTVRFGTSLVAVELGQPGTVATLIAGSKSGLTAMRAPVYVDSTGDGDLAAWAGAEFEIGGPGGTLQPASHCFTLGNVDEYAYRAGGVIHPLNPKSPIYDIVKSGKYPCIPDHHVCNGLVGPRTLGFNAGHLWNVDNTDPASVSQALMEGRKMAAAFRDALVEFYPKAFAASFVAATAPLMGVRETRRILGDYLLTIDDYQARRSFPDEICRNSYFIDVHHTADEAARMRQSGEKWEHRSLRYEKGESHGIPYRCLTPKGLRNVLVAGRSISSDRATNGSVRVMPVCLATGEAAGLAAALAVKHHDADVHAVDIGTLRQRLRDEGAYLPDVSYVRVPHFEATAEPVPKCASNHVPQEIDMTPKEILEQTRRLINEHAAGDLDKWWYANRFVFARLQLDERRTKAAIKQKLVGANVPCHGCGTQFTTARDIHLHRLNGDRGYSEANCVLMHGDCHRKHHAAKGEDSSSSAAGRPLVTVKWSSRYDDKPFLYWWDISPALAASLKEYEALEFVKTDTKERCVVPVQAIEQFIIPERQTTRGKGNWGVKVLNDRPDELAFEPGNKNGKWLFLPVSWLTESED